MINLSLLIISRFEDDPNIVRVIFVDGSEGLRHVEELGYSSWDELEMAIAKEGER